MAAVPSARSRFGGANVRFPPPLVFFVLIGAGMFLERRVPLTLPLELWPRVIAGAVVAIAGLLMIVSARVAFIQTGQTPTPWTPSPKLIVTGIYGLTRNPMDVGISFFMLGLGVASANGWLVIFAAVALLIVHFIAVLPEETYLADKFGKSYLRYKATVRRYL
jgi:protein-S-isoprenylcysteine O-methyltransferase Ste14